ncbi:tripartite tricarboxylate transporter substrate-binding protein [Falsiroseomonas sp. HW251]|uniref:tripartite tricarboxylate transporter substrate-binding protein n=1 Tax=Falsiroseomonas sp. HW251 TaxID=3390998 RepID=UPI003D317E0D
MTRLARRAALGALAAALPALARAQLARPVRILVGFAPGGPSDVVARLLAEGLHAQGHAPQAIVENRTGAGGRLSMEATAAAPPDGTTMVVGPASLATVYPAVYGRALRYDPLVDLTPVTPLCTYPFVLAVGAVHPARDVAGLVAWGKAQGGLACGNPAAGSMPHFLAVQFGLTTGVAMTHVPYRGSAPAVQDLVGGNLPCAMVTLGAVAELHRTGRIRVLAISSGLRAANLPDVPTFAEQGQPSLTAEEWIGLLLPGRAPAPVLTALHAATAASVPTAEFRAGLARLDYPALVMAPDAFAQRIRAEQAYWAPIVQASGFRPED